VRIFNLLYKQMVSRRKSEKTALHGKNEHEATFEVRETTEHMVQNNTGCIMAALWQIRECSPEQCTGGSESGPEQAEQRRVGMKRLVGMV